jgi:hypothetical protein
MYKSSIKKYTIEYRHDKTSAIFKLENMKQTQMI